jgi:hypothetical protein
VIPSRIVSRLVLGFLLVALAAPTVSAEPPTGFSQFPWGTSPSVIREQLLAKRCTRVTEGHPAGGWYQLVCYGYSLEDVAVPSVGFDFDPPDSLAGYSMRIARGSYQRFRDLALQRFGRPTSRRGFLWQGAVISWTSDTVTATLTEKCGLETSCMDVSTRALEAKRRQLIERERRDSLQGF